MKNKNFLTRFTIWWNRMGDLYYSEKWCDLLLLYFVWYSLALQLGVKGWFMISITIIAWGIILLGSVQRIRQRYKKRNATQDADKVTA